MLFQQMASQMLTSPQKVQMLPVEIPRSLSFASLNSSGGNSAANSPQHSPQQSPCRSPQVEFVDNSQESTGGVRCPLCTSSFKERGLAKHMTTHSDDKLAFFSAFRVLKTISCPVCAERIQIDAKTEPYMKHLIEKHQDVLKVSETTMNMIKKK